MQRVDTCLVIPLVAVKSLLTTVVCHAAARSKAANMTTDVRVGRMPNSDTLASHKCSQVEKYFFLCILLDVDRDCLQSMRSGPGEARTILLFHIMSVRTSKQPLMVRTFLKVYMELCSYFLFLQEQIKDIIIRGFRTKLGRAQLYMFLIARTWTSSYIRGCGR